MRSIREERPFRPEFSSLARARPGRTTGKADKLRAERMLRELLGRLPHNR
jgi:hypothetical protein